MINTSYSMPSFKGLIYFKDDKKVVNTDSIRSMEYNYQDGTDIFFKSVPEAGEHEGRLSVRANLETILKAYKDARDKDTVVVVKRELAE